MANLYRKAALDRLSSPDRLDCMLTISSPMTWVAVAAAAIICVAVILWSVFGYLPVTETGMGVLCAPYSTNSIYSDRGGTVTEVLVKKGSEISEGDAVLKIKDIHGDEQVIFSDQNGIVTELYIEKGMDIGPLDEIIRISPISESKLVAVCYVPVRVAKQLKNGTEAGIYLSSCSSDTYGYITATVINVDSYAASTQSMCGVLGEDGQLAAQISQSGPVAAVLCELDKSSSSVSGYNFSNKNGNSLSVSGGEIVTVRFQTERRVPITWVFPMLED